MTPWPSAADEAHPAEETPAAPPSGSQPAPPSTGPDTSNQLVALNRLGQIAAYQEIPEAFREPVELPAEDGAVNTGPRTTGQLIALNHLAQISSFQATPKRGPGRETAARLLDLRNLSDASPGDRADTKRSRFITRVPWPLFLVLAAQIVLGFKLLRSNTAFTDEALYLWAGHLQWAHWLDGAKIPAFPTYFSGSPVIYPPIGALADSIGGLTGARLLSMAFILGATCLLWATASRLFGRSAAFFAAALFAFLGPTLKLSAFATYDAMAIFLMALATWCAIHAGPRKDIGRWMIAAACALVLADATAYSYTIMDPVVIGIVLLTGWPLPSVKLALSRGVALIAYVVALVITLLTLGGGLYSVGIEQTVLTRAVGTDSPMKVLHDAAAWIGIVVVIAVVGVLVGLKTERERPRQLLLALLAGAALLVPVEQARIHTAVSLDKHEDMGAWFAAIAAGYAVSRLAGFLRPRFLRLVALGVATAALVVPARIALIQGRALFAAWPNSTAFIAAMRPLIDGTSGSILVETPSIAEYYLPEAGSQWERWSTTSSIRLSNGKSISVAVGGFGNPNNYISMIKKNYFTVIALEPSNITAAFDKSVEDFLVLDNDYTLADQVKIGSGIYKIWVLTEDSK
jgi:hypothetical protein